MSLCNISERLQKLRALRESLCKKEKTWQEAFNARDWIVEQIKELKTLTLIQESSKDDIVNRIEDLLCVLDPNVGDIDEK